MYSRKRKTGLPIAGLRQTQRILRDETGATLTEYGILVMALIAFGTAVMGIYGAQLQGLFQSIGTSLDSFAENVTKDMK